RHALRGLAGGAEPHPGVAGLAALPPGLEVVAAADAVEAGALGLDRLAQQVVGRELLVRAEVEVADVGRHVPRLPATGRGSHGPVDEVQSVEAEQLGRGARQVPLAPGDVGAAVDHGNADHAAL